MYLHKQTRHKLFCQRILSLTPCVMWQGLRPPTLLVRNAVQFVVVSHALTFIMIHIYPQDRCWLQVMTERIEKRTKWFWPCNGGTKTLVAPVQFHLFHIMQALQNIPNPYRVRGCISTPYFYTIIEAEGERNNTGALDRSMYTRRGMHLCPEVCMYTLQCSM